KRLVRRATFDIEHGNERDASLAARSILEMKPSSAAAARIMAELAEQAGERSALDWRRKVAQLDPHSVDDALALVRSAVQFNDIATAERALSTVDDNARNTAPYHAATALIAQAKHEDEKAEAKWASVHFASAFSSSCFAWAINAVAAWYGAVFRALSSTVLKARSAVAMSLNWTADRTSARASSTECGSNCATLRRQSRAERSPACSANSAMIRAAAALEGFISKILRAARLASRSLPCSMSKVARRTNRFSCHRT